MSVHQRQYVIRLSAEGRRQLEGDLRALGVSGQRSLGLIRQAARPASQGLVATDRAARDLKGALAAVGAELPALQRLARYMGTTALVGGLVAFGRTSLDVGMQFQAAMKRVQAVTQASEGDLERLGNAARDVGGKTAFTAMQAADTIEVLAKNGMDLESILGGALTATVALAGALGADLAPAGDLVTDIMAQFKLQATDLPRIADLVSGAALTSKFGFDDLRLAIGQAGGVAGSFGVTVEDLFTALSATSASFASGSDAGTSFKNFLQRLTPQSVQAASAMADLNLEFYDGEGRMKSMAEIAETLRLGVEGLTDEARNEALQKIFGTDAIRTALSLAERGADGFRALGEALGNVSAADQAQVRLEGLEGALKELTAAWEALRLTAVENGGLDLAEAAVDRLAEALRYLAENFPAIEEAAERLAQALLVYLAGRGITLAISKAVALRASYIELAASMRGLSVASGLLKLGGTPGLVLTAATLAALAIDTDRAQDAMEKAKTSAGRAAGALDDYKEAARRAAQEQKGLAGEVSAATSQMLQQSEAALLRSIEGATRDRDAAFAAFRKNSLGSADARGIADAIAEPNEAAVNRIKLAFSTLEDELQAGNLNRYLYQVGDALERFRNGEGSFSDFLQALEQVERIPPSFADLADQMDALLAEGEPAGAAFDELSGRITAAARTSGLFAEELAAIASASSDVERAAAWSRLTRAVREAQSAGQYLRSELTEGQRDLIAGLGEAVTKLEGLQTSYENNAELQREIAGVGNPFSTVEEGARNAAVEVERLNAAHAGYFQRAELGMTGVDRGSWQRAAQAAADKGVLDLIGYAEGTDKGRGYNETLGYGQFTGGAVNLINMTLREVLALQRQMLAHPDNGFNSSAVGRYQIVGTTLGGEGLTGEGGLIRQLGLSLDDIFTPQLQDRLALELVRQTGFSTGRMQSTWEGLRYVPGSTIQDALGVQSLPTQDPNIAAQQEEQRRLIEAREDALAQLVLTGNEQIDQLALEAELAGKSAAEQARLTYLHRALTEAKRAGIDVDTAVTANGERLIDVINRQADAIAERTAEQVRSRGGSDAEIAGINGSRDAIRNAFDNLKAGGEGLRGFFGDLADYIASKLWELAFDPVWDALAAGLNALLGGFGASAVPASASGGAVARADGGMIPGFADGGRPGGAIRGAGGKRQDNILMWGSVGEFMQPAAAVEYYGVGFMEAIRQRRLPRFAEGGVLPRGFSGGGGATAAAMPGPSIVYAPQNDFRGVDPTVVERLEAQQRRDAAEFEARVHRVLRTSRNRMTDKNWKG